ncbi:MAG: hypothetical protein K5659_06680 [Lachnospiraceae bacterium]|nr:hypothetical protein [Lachnospiraceae bacterium]
MKKKWIIILSVIVIIPMLLIVWLIGGRGIRREWKLKKMLRDRYDEKFTVVREYCLYGGLESWPNKRFVATCAPVNNRDVVFEVDYWDNDIEDARILYFHGYVANQIEDILQEDLEQFFPDCYVHCSSTGVRKPEEEGYVFNNKSLNEIIEDSPAYENEEYANAFIYLYINKDVGTLKKYEEEYEYFTKTIDEYVAENKMREVSVNFYYVDSSFLEEVREYYKCHSEPKGEFWERMEECNNMFASFAKAVPAYIENEGGMEEYIRRREEFENNK